VDLLESGGRQGPSRATQLARRLPARAVAAALALAVVVGLLALDQVQRAQQRADDVSATEVRLVVERTRRAGDGSAYGFARLEVADPAGRPVVLQDLDLDVPGVRLGSRGIFLRDLPAAGSVVLPLRLAVPDCAELVLPGRLRVQVARPGRVGSEVSVPVDEDAAGAALRQACGRARD
jgi:hypothetical protein